MSTIALESKLSRSLRFYEASIGKKVVMAVSGVVLVGYIIGHLLGNLQIYIPDGGRSINRYAAFLHSNPGPLWIARLILLAAVGAHILSSVQLWLQNRRARPVSYRKKDDVPASYAARTMIWSGPIIAAFVIFHVLHLTNGAIPGVPYEELNVYYNITHGFLNPWVSGFYILAMILLCMHLYHGVWSMFQSVGVSHPRYTPLLQRFAALFAILVAIGNISIPLSVLTGLIGGSR